jgi:hypothetical protein
MYRQGESMTSPPFLYTFSIQRNLERNVQPRFSSLIFSVAHSAHISYMAEKCLKTKLPQGLDADKRSKE